MTSLASQQARATRAPPTHPGPPRGRPQPPSAPALPFPRAWPAPPSRTARWPPPGRLARGAPAPGAARRTPDGAMPRFLKGMAFAPFLLVTWSSAAFIISYVVAVLSGHVNPFLPYIR